MIVLYVLAGWLGVTLLTYFLLLPLLKMSAQTDGEWPVPEADPETAVPSPQRVGYAGVVLERLAQHTRTVLGFDQAWILVSPGPGAAFAAVAGAGTDPDLIGRRVARKNGDGAVHGAASAPVRVGAEELGELCVGGPAEHRELVQRDHDLLDELAGLVGEVLGHHAQRQLTLGDSEAEIRALVRALAEADGDTYLHSLEVAAAARQVAQRLGLNEAEVVEIELAALLHDVGKLRVPARVLDKPGILNSEERALMRLHPRWGAEMVARVPGLEAVALIVHLHHERLDGQGYPYGLTTDQIPLASRIVAACAAYGAMTKSWAHRDPLDVAAALDELSQHAGTQFDPDVVEALAASLRQPVAVAA